MPHSTLYIDNMQEKGSDRVMRRVGNQPSSRCLKRKFHVFPSWAAPKFILKKFKVRCLWAKISFGFGFCFFYCCITAHPPQVLKEQHIYLDFKFAGVSGRSHVFSTKYQLRWPDGDAEGLFPRWLTFMALTPLAGSSVGAEGQALGSFPCGPLCWVLELPHRMVAVFQERVSQESGSGSCQFF